MSILDGLQRSAGTEGSEHSGQPRHTAMQLHDHAPQDNTPYKQSQPSGLFDMPLRY